MAGTKLLCALRLVPCVCSRLTVTRAAQGTRCPALALCSTRVKGLKAAEMRTALCNAGLSSVGVKNEPLKRRSTTASRAERSRAVGPAEDRASVAPELQLPHFAASLPTI